MNNKLDISITFTSADNISVQIGEAYATKSALEVVNADVINLTSEVSGVAEVAASAQSAAANAQSTADGAQSSATTAQATATAAQSAVDALETTVNKHGVTLQELPFNYPHFIRTAFVLKEGESCMLVQLPIGLERKLIKTLKNYVDNMPEENWWIETPYLNTYILPIYGEGEILNFDKSRNHIQHFQAWQVRCYDIVRSAELTPSVSTIISEPCIEIEFGEDMKTLYAEKLGLPCVAMGITEESMANRVWYFRDSKGQIVAKKGFQDEA